MIRLPSVRIQHLKFYYSKGKLQYQNGGVQFFRAMIAFTSS